MDKIKNNIKMYLPVYLIIIVTLIIFFIIRNTGDTPKSVNEEMDLSMFNVVNTSSVHKLFEKDEPSLLIIGSRECGATKDFIPGMQISSARSRYIINYLELLDENPDSKEYKDFVELLDYPYDEDDELKDYMGHTPMIIVIKNNKVVYGSVGLMSNESLSQVALLYGVANEEN